MQGTVTMADNKEMNNNQAAAAARASLPPVSKDEEKASPPLPVVPDVPAPVDDKVVKQIKPQRPLLAVLVDVGVKPASSLSISPPPSPLAAVMPADNNSKTTTTTTTTAPPDPVPILFMVCLWALLNVGVFAGVDVATLIANRTPCTKSTWLFRCVKLTDAAVAEATLLLYGQLLCSAAAALAAALHMLLTTRTTTTTTTRRRMRSRWGAAVDALAWVALAATAGIHCTEVASDRIFLAAAPGDTWIFVDVVFGSVYLAVDLLAGFILCSSPRRLELGEKQAGGDDGEV